MAAPPNFEEGQSTYKPPRFNGQYYGWWKARMHDFIMAEDLELWDVICDGPHVPMMKLDLVPKNRKEYSDIDRKAVKKNYRAKKILVKQSKVDMLTTDYELFRMKDDESIQDMHTRFTSIINELHLLGDVIPKNKLIRKILSVLPSSWESKVNAITEAKDLQTLTMDELIGNLKTYEMKRKKDSEIREPKKETNLVLKAENSDSSEEDSDMAYLTKRFQKMVRRNGGILKRGSSSKARNNDLYHNKLLLLGETPLVNQFALMAQSNDDEEILTIKLGDTEQSRDDLVVCVVDLNKTISNLEKGKEALNEKINSVENERDDLMVVVVDLKETIEGFSNEKHTLEEKIAATEQERDDFLVIITDLEETIEGLKSELRYASIEKGKEVASESHIKLEKELNDVETSLCGELEKNRQLQAELKKVKTDLEKSLKWTWCSDVVTAMYFNNSGNRQGIGFQKEKIPYNHHNKYVTVPNNWLCTHCGNNGHFKENYQARVQSVQKNKLFTKKMTTKEGPGNSERKRTTMVHGQWILKEHD
ncbi:MAR-binding filament-like protein 1 [Nicotiana sylvestris]|uniref:MAR-binding filament-like protein 1 n=1 Tax=Nicotiana sylvestris TaxID=4096 RepID=UPI00388CBFF7